MGWGSQVFPVHLHQSEAGVAGALARAEDAVRRGDYRSAIRDIDRGVEAFAPPRPPRVLRARTFVAAAIAALLLTSSAAALTLSATGRHTTGNSAAAIHIADSALTAADHVSDPTALADLVTSVQDTIADLTGQARTNPTLRAQLDALAKRQEQLVTGKANVPAALVTRARALVVAVQSLTPGPVPSVNASPAPTALP